MRTNILLFIAGLTLASCSSIQVTSDYDKTVDFSEFDSYSFYQWEQESDKLLNQLDKERIEDAVGKEFEARGLKYLENGSGDVTVSLFVVLEEKTRTTAYTNHYGAGGGYGYWDYDVPWGWGMGHSSTTYSEYDYIDGTLVIDVFDTRSKKLIWQGVGGGTVDENPQRRSKKMPAEIAQIMKSFPIEKPKN